MTKFIVNNRTDALKTDIMKKHKQILQGEPIMQDLNDPRKEIFSIVPLKAHSSFYFLPKGRQQCVKPPLLGRQVAIVPARSN